MLNLNALLMTANAVAYLGVLAMVGPVAVQRLRSVSRLALVGVLGGLAAACSSETLRMSGDPFANPHGHGRCFGHGCGHRHRGRDDSPKGYGAPSQHARPDARGD